MESLENQLQRHFGFSEFRGEQRPVIERAIDGQHSLVMMPTGMGKSLCYQLPSVVLPGMTLVISPLIALMKDQVDQAKKRGLNAAFINSSLDRRQREQAYQELGSQNIKLLYVTPERFRKAEFVDALKQNQVSLLAIDEAHCISQWGHDFRPDYTRIEEFRKEIGEPPTLALTATATPEVQQDIIKQCGLTEGEMEIFHGGISRPNLKLSHLDVHGADEKVRACMAFLAQFQASSSGGSAIIYFSLIDTLEKFSYEFRKLGVDHLVYHGRKDAGQRRKAQNLFMKGEVPLILATPAFGLGVDKENIRLVMHAETPGSIEAYYQEIGRAGRDGEPADCVLLYDGDDIAIQMDFIKWSKPDPTFIVSTYNLLERRKDEIRAEGLDYLRTQLNFYNRRDFRVETAINLLERWDCVEGSVPKGEYQVLKPPPEEYLDRVVFDTNMKKQQEKLLSMVNLAKADDCRKVIIYEYFGRPQDSPCGQCDNCCKKT